MAATKVQCWMCGAEIFADAFRCPECGAPPPERRQRERRRREEEQQQEFRDAARRQKAKEAERSRINELRRALHEARKTGDMHKLPREMIDQLANEIVITTENAPMGLEITKRVGIVSAETLFGMHLFPDSHTTMGEIAGGRADAALRALRNARAECVAALRREAVIAGADAVIAICFEHAELTGTGGSSVYVMAASGTAIKFKH